MSFCTEVDKLFHNWLISRSLLGDQQPQNASYSIAIESPCVVCQPRVALKLANYLDEFDGNVNKSSWLSVNQHRLEQLQANQDFRTMLGHEQAEDPNSAISCLSQQGGVIFELPDCFSHITTKQVFQVSMSCQEPDQKQHHLWLNAKRIPEKSLIPMIANAFFDWAEHGGDLA